MTEEQGDQIIELLGDILTQLRRVESNTGNIPSTNYDSSDICNKLDEVVSAINDNN